MFSIMHLLEESVEFLSHVTMTSFYSIQLMQVKYVNCTYCSETVNLFESLYLCAVAAMGYVIQIVDTVSYTVSPLCCRFDYMNRAFCVK